MKIVFLSLLATPFFITLASAEDIKSHPCFEIKRACEEAGFKKGGHKEGKGLGIDCVKKLMNGETVEGVTLDEAKMKACKEKREMHKKNKN